MVRGETNLADALTKHVDGKTLLVHIGGMSLETREYRHMEAPDVAGDGVIESVDWEGIPDVEPEKV